MGPKIGRGKAYKEVEISYLVEFVDRYLPYGQNIYMWDSLAEKFNQKFPKKKREGKDLKSKFKALKNVLKPTGGPSIPINVLNAKRAQVKIERRQEVALMSGLQSEQEEEDEELPLTYEEIDELLSSEASDNEDDESHNENKSMNFILSVCKR